MSIFLKKKIKDWQTSKKNLKLQKTLEIIKNFLNLTSFDEFNGRFSLKFVKNHLNKTLDFSPLNFSLVFHLNHLKDSPQFSANSQRKKYDSYLFLSHIQLRFSHTAENVFFNPFWEAFFALKAGKINTKIIYTQQLR